MFSRSTPARAEQNGLPERDRISPARPRAASLPRFDSDSDSSITAARRHPSSSPAAIPNASSASASARDAVMHTRVLTISSPSSPPPAAPTAPAAPAAPAATPAWR
ncbi:unnamed protein product [Ectocarpus sp. 8 AP-2014]